MPQKLKVGVIGIGGIATTCHLPAWKELAAKGVIELVGACDLIESRAQQGVVEFGAQKSFLDFEKMLAADDYDIIDICTTNKGHAPITLKVLAAGANVLVEKPMAMNVGEAEQMIAAAKKYQKTLMVAQNQRFEASSEKLKAVIESGELGQIYYASARYLRRRGIPGWGKFHIKSESMGGPLIDIGVHAIDLVLWLMGMPKPVSVSGKVYRMFGDRPDLCNGDWGIGYPAKEFDVEDFATGFVRFENNLTMTVETAWALNIPEDYHGITIMGDKAGVSNSPLGVFGAKNGSLTSSKFDWLPKQPSHREEIIHFVDCVSKGLPVRVQPTESLIVQKIIDGIYESSEKNQEIKIK